MDATKIDEALQRATNEFGLCPNRVWAIGHNLEDWEKKLPGVCTDSSSGLQGVGIAQASGGMRFAYRKTKPPKTRQSGEWNTTMKVQGLRLFTIAIFGAGDR